jgi:hypothetical protein
LRLEIHPPICNGVGELSFLAAERTKEEREYSWKISEKGQEVMAVARANKTIQSALSAAERLLWEKYNKPNRNLFEALSAFEGNGIGRKVVRIQIIIDGALS